MAQGFTVWLTGLSGAGKSTIARALGEALVRRERAVELLDGDAVRTTLSKGLGFSREDRDANVARIALVASLLSKHGVATITAAISPYAEARDAARSAIENFIEVYVECPLEVLARRDVKGLYAKAMRGELAHFTGVSDPYEPPEHPDVVVRTAVDTVDESVATIVAHLEERRLLGAPTSHSTSPSYAERVAV